MIQKCSRCQWQISKLSFSREQRLEIRKLLQQNLSLHAIQYIKENSRIGLTNSKGAVQHLNKAFGKCINCDYTQLETESMECPKCQAFNYNWKD